MLPEDTTPIDADEPTEDATEPSYWVASDNCVIGPPGTPVTAEQLEGLHVQSLVEAGHLSTTPPHSFAGPDGDLDPAASSKGI